MRLPWQQAASDAPESEPDVAEETYDPYWGETAADEGDADPLSALDDDGRAAAQAYAEAQVAAARAEQAAALEAARAQGFEITPTGVAVRDPQTAGRWFGASVAEQRPQRAEPQPVAAPVAPPQPEAEPDRWGDPEAHDRWVIAQATRQIQEALAPLVQQNQTLAEVVRSREASTALDRAKAMAVGNPMLEMAVAHPDFAAQFAQAIEGQTPDMLVNPTNLRWTVGMVGAGLDASRMQPMAAPPVTPARGNGGRTVSAELARESLSQTGPMNASVASPSGMDDGRIAPEVRQMVSKLNGFFNEGDEPSREQWEIAGSTPFYNEWKQQNDALEARQQARRGGRR